MALIQEAAELLRQSEGEGFSQNLSFQAEFKATGERGRPLSPVETELYKIAQTSISFNQTDYVTYVLPNSKVIASSAMFDQACFLGFDLDTIAGIRQYLSLIHI